jgi:UDP-N-acetylmuramoylalanine--D-glutamate ligase
VALRSFEQGVVLIAGGRGKGAPYEPLVELARGRVRAVLTVGEDALAIQRAFEGVVPVVSCREISVAIERARSLVRPGDTVLLSPACASYDQFKNFEDRGDRFKMQVAAL